MNLYCELLTRGENNPTGRVLMHPPAGSSPALCETRSVVSSHFIRLLGALC